jgi:hypothetical protein
VIAVLVTLMLAPGCSFIFSERAPGDHRERATFLCGESIAPPILDTVGVGVFGFTALGLQLGKEKAVADAQNMGKDPVQTRHDINVSTGVFLAFTAIDMASAIYGSHAVADCRRAQETRAAEVARARWLPPPYGVAPYGEPPPLWPPPLAQPPPVAPPPPTPTPAAPAEPAAPVAAPEAPPATPSP